MSSNLPPHLKAASDHLAEAIQRIEKRPADLQKAPWAELEKSVVKVLGGAFNLEQPEHQAVALGLAAALGERLAESNGAFWFPNRESPEAAMLGFPDAILMISPFGAVMDALSQGNLALLDGVIADVRKSLAQSKFSVAGGSAPRLSPEDYRRLFDAGFVQLLRLDPNRLKTLMDSRPDALAREFRDALGRTGRELPDEAKQQFEQQVVSSLQRLDPAKPLGAQAPVAPRLVELLVHLFATAASTGAAPEEFWYEVVVPLLFIGAPAQFPPLDAEDLELVRKGADPLALFIDLVPYQKPAPEEGLLGLFEPKDITLIHPGLGQGQVPPRVLQLKPDAVQALVTGFDPEKSKEAFGRFVAYLSEKAGQPVQPSPQAQQMLDAGLMLLTDLKRVLVDAAKDKSLVGLRRITEAEASSEGALMLVRKALQGPRIILAP